MANITCKKCKRGFVGEKRRQYCTKSCSVKAQHDRGEVGFEKFNPRWNGGIHWDRGYRMLYRPGHSLADSLGYVYEHRLVMEEYLFEGAIVHHRNGIKHDNRQENLEVITRAEHNRVHIRNPQGL